MWKEISQLLAEQFGSYYHIKSKKQLSNNEMHDAWIIDDGITSVFVKANERRFRSMFRAEADQLTVLAKSNTLNVPRVLGVGCSTCHSFILLEALPIEPLQEENLECLATRLATLHLWFSQEKYGFDFDTWLGPVHQPNQWSSNWSQFFSNNRIGWQLQLCKEKGIEFGNIEEITYKVKEKLHKHEPKPALLHGNLWRKNCGAVDNEVVLFDPACYWGDHECDLAFCELFEPFSQTFFDTYNSINPIKPDYQSRKVIYQLYYLLNFSHRFGGESISRAQKIINEL